MVYDYAGFDCLMHMNSKGVVIKYSPYFSGPYLLGYIEVTIPYRDQGLYLMDIYGGMSLGDGERVFVMLLVLEKVWQKLAE